MLGTVSAFLMILSVLALRNIAKAVLLPVYAVRDIQRGRYVRGLMLLTCSGLAAYAIWALTHAPRLPATPVATAIYTG